jgi:hypothetical protein
MRSSPCRWISGSTVPSSLTRRSTIWIDCSTDWRMRSVTAATRHGHADQPAAGIGHFHAALAAAAENAAERLRQVAQLSESRRRIGFGHAHLDGLAANGDAAGNTDARLTQRTAGIVDDLLQLVLLHRIGIDFQQDVRATLQVEAEHDMALRPLRPTLDGGLGEEIRNAHRQTTSAVRMIASAFQREK